MRFERVLFTTALSLCFSLVAPGMAQSSLALQSTATLKVFVYTFPGVSSYTLEGAQSEASRMLRPAQIELRWIDCALRAGTASCEPAEASKELIIRFLPKALPQAGARVLGIAGSSAGYATAFIFYDRVLALRTHTRLLADMLGRVLAHEITHLLLPHEDHSAFGLMRGQWSADDLLFTSAACFGLSRRSARLMHTEALRIGFAAATVDE